ncbi:hypothetical protein MTO96_007776 [Rhipicephalus appendiculatus]
MPEQQQQQADDGKADITRASILTPPHSTSTLTYPCSRATLLPPPITSGPSLYLYYTHTERPCTQRAREFLGGPFAHTREGGLHYYYVYCYVALSVAASGTASRRFPCRGESSRGHRVHALFCSTRSGESADRS